MDDTINIFDTLSGSSNDEFSMRPMAKLLSNMNTGLVVNGKTVINTMQKDIEKYGSNVEIKEGTLTFTLGTSTPFCVVLDYISYLVQQTLDMLNSRADAITHVQLEVQLEDINTLKLDASTKTFFDDLGLKPGGSFELLSDIMLEFKLFLDKVCTLHNAAMAIDSVTNQLTARLYCLLYLLGTLHLLSKCWETKFADSYKVVKTAV